jgi:hypothetical protein
MNPPLVQRVDHLVYATPNLDSTVDDLERVLGVKATPGGRHPGRGTCNALIALGPRCYLEIVGPDPTQPAPASPRWFGIDVLPLARLVTWAAGQADLERFIAKAAAGGVSLGPIRSGRREQPDGAVLRWQFTDPTSFLAEGVIPFFIDWGAGPHPASAAAPGPVLVGLRAEHPDPPRVRAMLSALGLDLPIAEGSDALLVASLRTSSGTLDLR